MIGHAKVPGRLLRGLVIGAALLALGCASPAPTPIFDLDDFGGRPVRLRAELVVVTR